MRLVRLFQELVVEAIGKLLSTGLLPVGFSLLDMVEELTVIKGTTTLKLAAVGAGMLQFVGNQK